MPRHAQLIYSWRNGAILGALQNVQMDPCNGSSSWNGTTGLDRSAGLTLSARTRSSISGVLDGLLPGPATPIDAKELKQFGSIYGPELARSETSSTRNS